MELAAIGARRSKARSEGVLCVRRGSLLAAAVLLTTPAHADAFDVVGLLLGVPAFPVNSLWGFLGLAVLALAFDYAMNALVVGMPAHKVGAKPWARILVGLVWLTMLGQLADRVGAIISLILTGLVFPVLPVG